MPHVLCEPSNLWWGRLPAGATNGPGETAAAALVVPSAVAGAFWKSRGATASTVVIPPGFEAGPAPPERVVAKRGATTRVGWVGRLAPQKSPGLFVRAVAALAARGDPLDAAVVVGDGPLREPLERLARRLGLVVTGGHYVKMDPNNGTGAVHFAGWLPPEKVRARVGRRRKQSEDEVRAALTDPCHSARALRASPSFY